GQSATGLTAGWHFVPVAGTRCLDGSQTGIAYNYRTGNPASPLLFYFDGGGACWDGETCDCMPDSTGTCNNPSGNATIQMNHIGSGQLAYMQGQANHAAFTSANSPFGSSWNFVFIPYCTGDVHAGGGTTTPTVFPPNSRGVTI